MDDPAPPGPRLIKKVAVGYDLTAMPPAIIRCFTMLRSKLERAGYAIEVGMRPVTALPPDLDVLFVSAELAERAAEWGSQLAQGPVRAMGLAKRDFNQAVLANLEQVLDYEAHIQEIAGQGGEHKEGVQAFLEKRRPSYR